MVVGIKWDVEHKDQRNPALCLRGNRDETSPGWAMGMVACINKCDIGTVGFAVGPNEITPVGGSGTRATVAVLA